MTKIIFDKQWEDKVIRNEHLSEEALSAKESNFEEWVLNLMEELATNHYARVISYSYRTALVFDEMFDADRESMRPLEYILAIKAGVAPDNHTVYEVYNGGQTFYVWCTDSKVRVGKKIRKESW